MSNEMITETFSIDGIFFACIENRILQIDRSGVDEAKKKYDPLLSYITSVGCNGDHILYFVRKYSKSDYVLII